MDMKPDENTKPTKNWLIMKYALAALAILVGLGFIVAVLYGIIDFYTAPKQDEISAQTTTTTKVPQTSTMSTTVDLPLPSNLTSGNILDYFAFANNDGVNVAFFHAANSKDNMEKALQGNFNVVEGDVFLISDEMSSQKENPVMGNTTNTNVYYELTDWLDAVIETEKAFKLDIKSDEAVPLALDLVKSRASKLHQPVWISADIVTPTGVEHMSAKAFIEYVNGIYPYVTISLGWFTDSKSSEDFTWDSMDKMWLAALNLSQGVTFSCRASLVRTSWSKFLWLLEQSNKFSLTVWNDQSDIVKIEDLVYFRDNLAYSRVFYELSASVMADFRESLETKSHPKIFYSGGNTLDYFRKQEAINITWAHRVNEIQELDENLNNDTILMLEADVRLYGEGTNKLNDTLPVMSHDPPALNYNLTLRQWLENVIAANKTKGIKLDFKTLGALNASLIVLQDFKTLLNMPVWINSDILHGPNSTTNPVNAELFFENVQNMFSDVTISPGWTTAYFPGGDTGYSYEMVEEMHSFCASMRQAITFPVRASFAHDSIQQFQWLLSKSNRYTITIWHSTAESVTTEHLLEFYQSFPSNKVYFDIPEKMMQDLQNAISSSNSIRVDGVN